VKDSAWQVFFLALITLLGGVDGYMSAGSVASLIGGGIFGLILLGSTVLLLQEKQSGWFLALISTFLLLLQFAPEFQVEGTIYPAGLMAAVSVWIIGALIVNRIWEMQQHSTSH